MTIIPCECTEKIALTWNSSLGPSTSDWARLLYIYSNIDSSGRSNGHSSKIGSGNGSGKTHDVGISDGGDDENGHTEVGKATKAGKSFFHVHSQSYAEYASRHPRTTLYVSLTSPSLLPPSLVRHFLPSPYLHCSLHFP